MEAREMFCELLRQLTRVSQDAGRFIDTERRLERRIEQIEPELKATTEKLGEWIDYSRKLRAIIGKFNAKSPMRGKLTVMPPEPEPVELPIPF
jgi:transcriptional regulator with GAF, ATPase, and Fis domain